MRGKKFTIKKLLIVVLIIYAAVTFIKQEISSFKLSSEIQKAESELKSQNDKNAQLQDELNLANNDINKYREVQARERLGYIKQNETPVKAQANK